MKTLHDSKFNKIEFNSKKQILNVIWKPETENMETEDMLIEVLKICELIVLQKPKSIFADDRKKTHIYTVEEQEWVAQNFGKSCIKVNLEKFAILNSEELVAELSIEQTLDEIKNAPFQKRFFSTEKEAVNWLSE